MNNVISFPAHRVIPEPEPETPADFPMVDEGVLRVLDPRDRVIFDAAEIEVSDDRDDEFATLPVRVGTRYGAPVIELGMFSMGLDDARRLAEIIGRFAAGFREVPA